MFASPPPILLLLLVAAAMPRTLTANSTPCDGGLFCRHGATCHKGNADYDFLLDNFPDLPFLSTKNVDGEYCKCPHDRTAVDCGTKLLVCDVSSGFSCFNNGDCTTTSQGIDHCDCSVTHKDGFTIFAGRHCEFEATDVCQTPDDGLEGDQWFCANKGECNPKESDINKKCDCPEEWTGPHCEFHKSNPEVDKFFECSLTCQNRGSCKHGSKHHEDWAPDNWLKEIDGMHCVCKDGYAGVQCDFEVEKCGNGACLNGSKCLTRKDPLTNKEIAHCDCTQAHYDGKLYAGRWCQYDSTTYCDGAKDGVGENLHFCVNGGECEEFGDHKDCNCEDGFSGSKCEFNGDELPCTLKCENGGQCRHGINPDIYGLLGSKFDISLPGHSGFMHCSCPEGFLGVDCSTEYVVCGPKQEAHHACANGGKCIVNGKDVKGKKQFSCDCGTRNPFAGPHCEHAATKFCAKAEESVMGSWHAFCTNGGDCAETINEKESHPGCHCGDDWEGEHCEYTKGTSPSSVNLSAVQPVSGPTKEYPSNSAGMKASIVVGVLTLVGLVGAFIAMKQRRRWGNEIEKSGSDVHHTNDAEDNRSPRGGLRGNGDFKSEEHMTDIEII